MNQTSDAARISGVSRAPAFASIWPILILLLAAIVRLPGTFTDFWGDEIWSWQIAGKLHRVSDILLSQAGRIDNNHPLNTLWLYLLGQNADEWQYRLPALLAGIGTVAAAMHCMSRRDPVAGIAAGLLTALQFPLVFYSTEARGYSLAVFFGVVAFDALDIVIAADSSPKTVSRARWIFAIAASLGFLSHLTLLHVYAAAFVWSIVKLRGNWRQLIELHALPILTAFILQQLFIKHMVIGGALPTNAGDALEATWCLMIGGPVRLFTVAIVTALFALALMFDEDRTQTWIFYLVVVLVSPALVTGQELLFGEHPQPLMPRYFLICMPFYLLSLCPLVQGCWQRAGRFKLLGRVIVIVAAILFVLSNGMHYARFLRDGRGHPREILQQIARDTPSGSLSISTDALWRTQLLFAFYAPRLRPHRDIDYADAGGQWLILNRRHAVAADAVIDFKGDHYQLRSTDFESELSAWAWFVYRKV